MGKSRPLVMGVVNVTPDSFSDGGQFSNLAEAVAHAHALVTEGADIVDVGGESTRPGAPTLDEAEELERVVPVVRELATSSDVFISVDTTKAVVAKACLEAGARMVNDVSMLRHDDQLARVAAAAGAELVLMHSRRSPENMQRDVHYDDLLGEVIAELKEAVDKAEAAGVHPDKIWVDPGIGFAKTAEHNVELLARLDELSILGKRILVGPSRKSFIGHFTGAAVNDRLGGTAAAVAASVSGGAAAVRVHEVAVMAQVVQIAYQIAAYQIAARQAGVQTES